MGNKGFSEEERNEYKEITLKMLLEGKQKKEIEKYIGVSQFSVDNFVNALISERKNYKATNTRGKS